MRYWILIILALAAITLMVGCSSPPVNTSRDTNVSVPTGDPGFPEFEGGGHWVIDEAGVMSPAAIDKANAICQKMHDEGTAYVVVVIIKGVKHPNEWATHFGRKIALGKSGPSLSGGNNGIVWLFIPDAKLKLNVSVGRGLMSAFTSQDWSKIEEDNADYINFDNYDTGVVEILNDTDRVLRDNLKENGKG